MARVLAPFRIVLQSTLFPLNLGSVARAAANFDARDIALVSPRCDFESTDNYVQRDAFAMACGPARDYLLGARRFGTLEEALEGCEAAVAFTARSSRARLAVCGDPLPLAAVARLPGAAAGLQGLPGLPGGLPEEEEGAPAGAGAAAWPSGQVALVFGPEDNGLEQEELALCTHTCALRTAETMTSLNLSHAVAVVLASLYEERLAAAEVAGGAAAAAAGGGGGGGAGGVGGGAASEETHAVVAAVMGTLQRAFGQSMDLKRLGGLMGPVREVLLRAAPTADEARVLHALARHVARLGGATDRLSMKSDPARRLAARGCDER